VAAWLAVGMLLLLRLLLLLLNVPYVAAASGLRRLCLHQLCSFWCRLPQLLLLSALPLPLPSLPPARPPGWLADSHVTPPHAGVWCVP
jgi:hypothetical protein